MKIIFHRNFEKQYKKLSKKERVKTRERLKIFMDDPFDRLLNNHPLKGKYLDYRSINIAGDIRTIYKYISENEAIFVAIGRHSELYH